MVSIRIGLTFNDALLVPKRTSLKSRSEARTETLFTRNIKLKIPFVSSNMVCVTEHKMAIAMAREGGLGVIHQFGSVDEQVCEIKKVKRSTSYIVEEPVTVEPTMLICDALKIANKENVTSLLVTTNNSLVGIFTSRDYLFVEDWNKKISEVMTKKLVTAPYGIELVDAKRILQEYRIEKLPLIEDGKLKGLITTQDIKKLEQWKNATRDEKGRLRVGGAVGVKDTILRAKSLVDAGVDVLVLDIAHAHSDIVIERLKELKKHFDVDVMVGNIATKEAAKDLIDAGADGLKVGIGPSPVCTTRLMSGSGVPQLTAIMDVCEVAKQFNVPVCADGGMKFPGDTVKAIAAGAHSIFSGSFFAGTNEAPGRILTKDGRRYKRYMGSASYDSNHERKENKYGHRIKEKINVFVEGVSILVNYKGAVQDVLYGLVKGLKSGISYCGARDIAEMQKNAEFIQITDASWNESQSHGRKLSD